MGSNATKGMALIVLGVLVNNLSYLYDVILDKHEGWIFLGGKAQSGVAVGVLAVVIGLFLIWRGSKTPD
ncbi:MAG: hypothetical protein COA65_07975 [Rhodospirillaceae bacterium]|nr:MAG: hypothetical protein COA65_07975 [Rhodospirillaceae bacterium]